MKTDKKNESIPVSLEDLEFKDNCDNCDNKSIPHHDSVQHVCEACENHANETGEKYSRFDPKCLNTNEEQTEGMELNKGFIARFGYFLTLVGVAATGIVMFVVNGC